MQTFANKDGQLECFATFNVTLTLRSCIKIVLDSDCLQYDIYLNYKSLCRLFCSLPVVSVFLILLAVSKQQKYFAFRVFT